METFGTNPMLLEEANESTSQRAPLVLIHDSSGLVFHYLQLQQFDRAMYGIYDPHFFNEKEWEGGLSELATNYCGLLRQEIPRGKIILGGKWCWYRGCCRETALGELIVPVLTIKSRLVARWDNSPGNGLYLAIRIRLRRRGNHYARQRQPENQS